MKRTILLVEDNEQSRYLAKFLLQRHGFAIVDVADGKAALAAATASTPAAILLDIHLPGMDGYAVARSLRTAPSLARVPIIAVTSYAMSGDREKALAAGCDGYLEKPIDPATFVAEIEKILAEPRAPKA